MQTDVSHALRRREQSEAKASQQKMSVSTSGGFACSMQAAAPVLSCLKSCFGEALRRQSRAWQSQVLRRWSSASIVGFTHQAANRFRPRVHSALVSCRPTSVGWEKHASSRCLSKAQLATLEKPRQFSNDLRSSRTDGLTMTYFCRQQIMTLGTITTIIISITVSM